MTLRKSDGAWNVRRQISKRFTNKSEALQYQALLESALEDAERRFHDKVVPCCSIRGMLDEFLSNSRTGIHRKRRAGYRTLERHRQRLLLFDNAFKGRPLDAVPVKWLERWMTRRMDAGVSPDTVNADLISLHAFARWAQAKQLAPAFLPILTVNKLPSPGKLAGKNRKPPKAREMGEMQRIIRKIMQARADMGLFLIGMALFGLRPANICQLRREDVRLPRAGDVGRLHVVGLKGAPDRDIVIPPGSARERWVRDCLALSKRASMACSITTCLPWSHNASEK